MKLLLIDDHMLFRQGLHFLLGELGRKLSFSEAGDCQQALAMLHEATFDLILLDLLMPGSRDMDALELVVAAAPTTPVAVLSGSEDPSMIRTAIEMGASAYIPKSSSPAILVAALQLVLAGGVYLPAHTLDTPAPLVATPSPGEACLARLSQRRTEVLHRAVKGLPNKAIAKELGIAEGTVKVHLSSAYKVLGVRNRTEAVFEIARLGVNLSDFITQD